MQRFHKIIRVEFVDIETGEVVQKDLSEDQILKFENWKNRKKIRKILKNEYGEKAMFFQNVFRKAPRELSNDELKVFTYLLGVMDFGNWIDKRQLEISKSIGIDIRRVKKAIKGLKDKGYIQIKRTGSGNLYRINPNIAWKGSEKDLHHEIGG